MLTGMSESVTPIRGKRGRPRKDAAKAGAAVLRRAALHVRAVERLRAMIVQGELAPGTPLVEGDLAQALGLSRTPLREAVKLLAQEGLIELRANRSACVRALDAAEVFELFEALAGFERLGAELAATRLTPAGLRRLEDLQATIEQEHAAGRREAYYAANRAIHRAIIEAAQNRPLAQAHAALLARAEQARFLALKFAHRWEESIAEHRAILAALAERDAPRAGRLLADHVAHTAEAVTQALAAEAALRAA
ncbi:GntR family transcriptional regulator [Methylobacterium sp. J-077]|uniref:GntR family transcriptional regulator n=1 Tax=Methylobacterium sp. J-077 TaxID=2836656 RepID=UPI001FBA963C|nr:GntR family transcriptional regulator [Methylobacterium sp. J-077]MCJ2125157.1 GntR family transcriptional regulator [Methylobacterium sp. J-077]